LVIHDGIWLGKRREKSVVMEVGIPVEMTYTSLKIVKSKYEIAGNGVCMSGLTNSTGSGGGLRKDKS
jgi:hypothetical protein